MDTLKFYLDSNSANFSIWLNDYTKKIGGVNSRDYPYNGGGIYRIHYYEVYDVNQVKFSAHIRQPALSNQQPPSSAIEVWNIHDPDEGVTYTYWGWEMKDVLRLSWLETEKLRVTIEYEGAKWIISPVFQLLAAIKADYPSASDDINRHIVEKADWWGFIPPYSLEDPLAMTYIIAERARDEINKRANQENENDTAQPSSVDILPQLGSLAYSFRQYQMEEEKRNLKELIELRQQANAAQDDTKQTIFQSKSVYGSNGYSEKPMYELARLADNGDEQAKKILREVSLKLLGTVFKKDFEERDKLLADPYGKIILPWLMSEMDSENPAARLSAGQHSLSDIWDMVNKFHKEAISPRRVHEADPAPPSGEDEKAKTRKEKLQEKFNAFPKEKKKEYRAIGEVYKTLRKERDNEPPGNYYNVNADLLRDRLEELIKSGEFKYKLPKPRKLNYIIAMCEEGVI